jgi:hypothetical protein
MKVYIAGSINLKQKRTRDRLNIFIKKRSRGQGQKNK